MMAETGKTRTPVWQKAVAVVLAAVLAGWVLFDWHRFVSDFWPVDKSTVGPNLLAAVVQWTIILLFAALLWPPTRRRIHAFAAAKLRPLHEKLDVHHRRQEEHNRWVAAHVAAQHETITGRPADPHPHFDLAAKP